MLWLRRLKNCMDKRRMNHELNQAKDKHIWMRLSHHKKRLYKWSLYMFASAYVPLMVFLYLGEYLTSHWSINIFLFISLFLCPKKHCWCKAVIIYLNCGIRIYVRPWFVQGKTSNTTFVCLYDHILKWKLFAHFCTDI